MAGALLTAFIGGVVAGSPRLAPGEDDAFALVAVLCIAPAFAGCVMELYVMAEERERGGYLTLIEAGVAPGEIAVARWLAATVATLVTQAVACLLVGFEPAVTAALLALSAIGSQPLLLAGLACGLSAREQMASSLLAVPLTVIALAPVLAFMSDTVRAGTWFWPSSPWVEIARALCGMDTAVPISATVVAAAAWIVAAAALAVRACRRFARELAAERDRR